MSRRYPNPTRTKARKRALDILFEADLRRSDPVEALAAHVDRATPPVRDFTVELVEGVAREQVAIDNLIHLCLPPDWELWRMPVVDRNLARIAIYEIWWTDTPVEVAVDEAVTLGASLSTDESPDFLNGLLGRVLEYRRAQDDGSAAKLFDSDDLTEPEPTVSGLRDS